MYNASHTSQSPLPVDADALLGERDRLDGLLQVSEDWRALLQLRARGERGERLTTISEKQLETLLIETLNQNPFYQRRVAVEAALNDSGRRAAEEPAKPRSDDLKKIRRIDPELERRLHAINIWSYEEIAAWSAADVQNVAATLSLSRRISTENWIEQAALLASRKPKPAGVAAPASGLTAQTVPAQRSSESPAALQTQETKTDDAGKPTVGMRAPPMPAAAQRLQVTRPDIAQPKQIRADEPLLRLPKSETVPRPLVASAARSAPGPHVDAKSQATATAASIRTETPQQPDPDPEWVRQQIETLEAELLEIAFGPEPVTLENPASFNDPAARRPGLPDAATAVASPAPSKAPDNAPGTSSESVKTGRPASPAAAAPSHTLQPAAPVSARPAAPPPLPSPALDERLSGLLRREDYAAFKTVLDRATVDIRLDAKGAPRVPTPVARINDLPPAYPWPMDEPRDDSVPARGPGRR